MRILNMFILIFMMMAFLCSSIAIATANTESPADVKAEKEEPFLWDLIFPNTKSIVPMVSTPAEIAMSPYRGHQFTEISANKEKYTTGDRILIENHVWVEHGDEPFDVDYYIIFVDALNPHVVYFFDGSGWGIDVKCQLLNMSKFFDRVDTILDIQLTPNHVVGRYIFAAGLAEPVTDSFYKLSTVTIQIY